MDRPRTHRVARLLFCIALVGACAIPLNVSAARPNRPDDKTKSKNENPPSAPDEAGKAVWIYTPNFAKGGQEFQVDVWLVPASQSSEKITMDPTWGVKFSPPSFVLGPGERRSIRATIDNGFSGVAWVHAHTPAAGYEDGWFGIPVDFQPGLKLSSHATIAFKSPTTFTVSINDSAGKPLKTPCFTDLRLEYEDGELSSRNSGWSRTLPLELPAGSQTSPTFQLRSTLRQGGNAHLLATLFIHGQEQVLAQEDFPLQADAAVWLTVLLAVLGGLLHGTYKVLRLEEEMPARFFSKAVAILLGSALAGLIGYFFAHLDLLGLKIDPNLLRSYPLIGFLFSYFGFEVLIPERAPHKDGTAEPDAAKADPKK